MSRNQKIALVVILVLVVSAIIYLEGIKAPRPTGITVQQTLANASSSTSFVAGSTTTTVAEFLAARATTIQAEAAQFQAAPEIEDPSGFVNSGPFQLSDYVGKDVVLVDFWTYSCINCIRTLPYVNAWYEKYKDQGLVVVGIHTPEFDFEHALSNVQAAVQKFGIQYPVVLDNDMATWNAFGNQYWPHEYLINIDGFIVHDHIGEGDYPASEAAIDSALQQRDDALNISTTTLTALSASSVTPTDTIAIDYNEVDSPETYFGAERNEYLANGTQGTPGVQMLTAPSTFTQNELYLDGTWNFQDQYATNQSANAKIFYSYSAKNVYIVAAADTPVTAQVLVDGKPIGALAGSDVSANGTVTIQADRLYNIVSDPNGYGEHTLELIVQNSGLQAYTFTFG